MTRPDAKLRNLPSVDVLAAQLLYPELSRLEVVDLARTAVGMARQQILQGEDADPAAIAVDLAAVARTQSAHRVVNATGVILHTNLGRAPLSSAASSASTEVSANYSNAELDLRTGERGSRGAATVGLLQSLTGAEDALVVNNNAAALLLALAGLAADAPVPVSRGELIEIGGSYRLPEIMAASGARMVEVGTTNKTRISDFELATQLYACAFLLKVHQANYELSGFTGSAGIHELVGLARRRDIPLVYDIGSGLIDERAGWLEERPDWLAGEPGVRQAIEAGADLVMFSGDKLLGGPQAGIVVGRAELVGLLRSHPLRRALRVDAATDAALVATLRSYANGTATDLPIWKMATLPEAELARRSNALTTAANGETEDGYSLLGAGSAPSARIPTPQVRMRGRQDVFAPLLKSEPPILTRRDRGDLLLNLRTVDPADDGMVIEAILKCL